MREHAGSGTLVRSYSFARTRPLTRRLARSFYADEVCWRAACVSMRVLARLVRSYSFARNRPLTRIMQLQANVSETKTRLMCATGFASVFTTGGLYVGASNSCFNKVLWSSCQLQAFGKNEHWHSQWHTFSTEVQSTRHIHSHSISTRSIRSRWAFSRPSIKIVKPGPR